MRINYHKYRGGFAQALPARKMDLWYLAAVGLAVGVWICSLTGSMDLVLELTFCAIHARVQA